MKSCPKCNRTFPDEGQKFCTFDGGLLIAPQTTFDPNATIRATSIDLNAASERPTSRDLPDPNATIIESYPATVALPRNTGPTGPPAGAPNTADIVNPAPPPAPPPPPPTAQTSQPLPPAAATPGSAATTASAANVSAVARASACNVCSFACSARCAEKVEDALGYRGRASFPVARRRRFGRCILLYY